MAIFSYCCTYKQSKNAVGEMKINGTWERGERKMRERKRRTEGRRRRIQVKMDGWMLAKLNSERGCNGQAKAASTGVERERNSASPFESQ